MKRSNTTKAEIKQTIDRFLKTKGDNQMYNWLPLFVSVIFSVMW